MRAWSIRWRRRWSPRRIDIETATYDGRISAPGPASFTYTTNFRTASDDYVYTIDYLAGATANGNGLERAMPSRVTSGGISPTPHCWIAARTPSATSSPQRRAPR